MNKPLYIFLYILVMLCCKVNAQTNLVYNGDFEIYSSCPNAVSSPGSVELTKCTGWINPTDATPDYFNTCNNPVGSVVGMPNNAAGSQYSLSGNGYVGIIPFEFDGTGYWYEYIQGSLITPLIKNKYYYFSFYVSLSDGYADVALKNLGAYFSQSSFTVTGTQKLNFTPQIRNTNFITDTSSWTKIDGVFKSNGAEKYLTIGYFDNIIYDSLRVNNLPPTGVSSYYYIDGVELYELQDSVTSCREKLSNIFTPNKDGINDILEFNVCTTILRTTIYNRWGEIVFDSKDETFWDGTTKSGESCVDGCYYYIIQTKEKIYKGYIQLVR